MNKKDKMDLALALCSMEEAKAIIENLKNAEQEKFENLSEGLQQSERGQAFETTAQTLEEIFDHLKRHESTNSQKA